MNNKKFRIAGYQTNIEWYDIKTKFKQLTRKIFYHYLIQEILAYLIKYYIKLVFVTSKKNIFNLENIEQAIASKNPLIITFWHNRLVMIPQMAYHLKTKFPDYNFMTLASKHGDGRIVGRVMEKFNLISILGSTKEGRKSSRGIDFASMRKIIEGLRQGYSLGITPDGPRGPNQQINGDVINIAKISQARLIAVSYSSSRFITFNSWDRFKLPLPFSKLIFYVDSQLILVEKKSDQLQLEKYQELLKNRLNHCQLICDNLQF